MAVAIILQTLKIDRSVPNLEWAELACSGRHSAVDVLGKIHLEP